MSTSCLLAALLLGQLNSALPQATLAGTEWPGYKGNGGLTGVSSDSSIRPPFKLLWTYRLRSPRMGVPGED